MTHRIACNVRWRRGDETRTEQPLEPAAARGDKRSDEMWFRIFERLGHAAHADRWRTPIILEHACGFGKPTRRQWVRRAPRARQVLRRNRGRRDTRRRA